MTWSPTEWGALCGQCTLNHKTPIKPRINRRALLVQIGGNPGKDEEIEKAFFVGQTGKLLDNCNSHLDIPSSKTHKTNALLCRPSYDTSEKDLKTAISCCRPRLAYELAQIEGTPTLQLMGKSALIAVTGKAKIFDAIGAPGKGGLFDSKGRRVASPTINKIQSASVNMLGYATLASLQPAYNLRQPAYTPVFLIHTDRAWKMANDKLPKWEWPTIVIDEGPEMFEALEYIRHCKTYYATDVETKIEDHSYLFNVGISVEDVAVSVQWETASPALRRLVKYVLETPHSDTGQNMQFDYFALLANGIKVNKFDFDTMYAHRVFASQLKHSLDFMACVEFWCERWKVHFKATGDKASKRFELADPVERAEYNAKDAFITWLLRKVFYTRLENYPGGWALMNEYMALWDVAVEMRRVGFPVDSTKFERHRSNLTEKVDTAYAKIMAITDGLKFVDRIGLKSKKQDRGFMPSNHHHVRELFLYYLHVQPTKYSKKSGDASFDKETLLRVCAHPNQIAADMARGLLEYRRWQKLKSTYVDGLPTVCYDDISGAFTHA